MNKLDRSFIYKNFKQTLASEIGKENTKVIWTESGAELNRLLRKYRHVSTDEKMMILPLNALYTVLRKHKVENALPLLKEYGKKTGDDLSALINKITAIPGLSRILWKNMPALMRKTSSPQKGYERRIV